MLFVGIDNILCHYNRADIYVTVVHVDNEFKQLFNDLEAEWEVSLNFSLLSERVPDQRGKQGITRTLLCRITSLTI